MTKPIARNSNAAAANSTKKKAAAAAKPPPKPAAAKKAAPAAAKKAAPPAEKKTASPPPQQQSKASSTTDKVTKKATAAPPTAARARGTTATVVAAVSRALTAHQQKELQERPCAPPPPLRNVDDLIVSRSNRERRPMQFYESGDDAGNSCAADWDRPVAAAPSSPFKQPPRRSHTAKGVATGAATMPPDPVTTTALTQATSDATRGKAKQEPAAPTAQTKKDSKAKATKDNKVQSEAAATAPAAATAACGGVAGQQHKRAPRAEVIVPPAAEPSPNPVEDLTATLPQPPVVPATPAPQRTQLSPPPPPPNKAAKKKAVAKPVTPDCDDECSAAPAARKLAFDDCPLPLSARPTTDTAVAPPPPSSSIAAKTLNPLIVVTAFMDTYVDKFGLGYSLGQVSAMNQASTTAIDKPFLSTGFLFRDGSSALIDGLGNLTYINAHRHRFTIRNVTGKVTIPERLQKKFQVLLCTRAAMSSFHQPPPAASSVTAVKDALMPDVTPCDARHTMWEHDVALFGPGDGPSDLDVTGPVYVCSSAPMAFHQGDAIATTATRARQFVLSRRSAPYPSKTYYCSDGTADV